MDLYMLTQKIFDRVASHYSHNECQNCLGLFWQDSVAGNQSFAYKNQDLVY